MRELKFRVWCEARKEMLPIQRHSFKTNQSMPYGWNMQYEFDAIMQYTGLKDRFGKEIYEGDIVKTSYGIGEVKHGKYEYSVCEEYGCVRYGWHVDIKYTCYVKNTGYDLVNHEYVEVVGNIYENPYLLEREE